MSRFWLGYDLGLRGDYGPLYVWLDNAKARECGDSSATFQSDKNRDQLAKELKRAAGSRARVYLIGPNKQGKIVGGFIAGGRKRAPWAGFAESLAETDEEE